MRILRRESKKLGFTSSFSIYDAADSKRLMALVCRDLDLDPKRFPPKSFSAKISNLKNELIDEEDFAAQAADGFEKTLAQAYAMYQSRLREANALDFDDLIMTTVNLLRAFPDVAEHYRRRFRHVLVDEYQDTNHAQYALVRELVGPAAGDRSEDVSPAEGDLEPAELCVVGDADQSIYAFRGATIRNILQFEEDYPDATTILLEQNYRSTQTILSAANAVIERNESRRPKNLWTNAGAGSNITGYVADTEHDEAQFVADEIDRLTDAGKAKAGDVAVFYRTNAQSRVFEEVFIRVGLPYKVVGGVRFYERKEVRDVLAYLRVLANPEDSVPLRRILNVPKRGIGERAEAMIDALSQREKISFAGALRRVDEAYGMAARSTNAVKRFNTLMEDLRTIVESGAGPATVLEAVLERTGYLAELQASTDPQDETRIENLQELAAVALEFEQESGEGEGEGEGEGTGAAAGAGAASGGLSAFLERVALVADSDQIPDEEDGNGVITLMTLHTAKGLEFPVVFLTGMEDGVFPHMRALGQVKELEEERRLAYVGITRAGAAVPHPLLHAQRMGPALVQPAVPLPGGDPGRTPGVEAHGRDGSRVLGPRLRRGRLAVGLAFAVRGVRRLRLRDASRGLREAGGLAGGRRPGHPRPVRAGHRGRREGDGGERGGDDRLRRGEAEAVAAAVRAGGEAVAPRGL